MSAVEAILNFWFGHPEEISYGKPRQVWFEANPEFDRALQNAFMSEYQWAATGELEDWKASPRSCLALILLLDQFPRNVFRGTPQAFATDRQALATARYAIKHQFDCQLLPVQRWFIYLPLEHSETLDDQQQSVELFTQLKDDPDSAEPIAFAIQHRDIIQRFGRFPHRNQILGRETTPEEAEFLKQPGSSF